MSEKHTLKGRRALSFSRTEAVRFGTNVIEPHHLLLGLFRADPELAAKLFDDPEAPQSIREQLESRFQSGGEIPPVGELPLAEGSECALAYAWEERQNLGHSQIATGHLLLGLLRELGLLGLREGEGEPTAELLLHHGAKPLRLRDEVARLPEIPDEVPADQGESA
jgi:ATP-dependent Clp protease ATP-binding subunit ClpA